MWKYLLILFFYGVSQTVSHEFVETLNIPGLYGKPSENAYSLPQIDDSSVLLSIKGKHDARVPIIQPIIVSKFYLVTQVIGMLPSATIRILQRHQLLYHLYITEMSLMRMNIESFGLIG
jgi:hypothetical protein